MDIISPVLFLLLLILSGGDTTAQWWTWVMDNNQTNLLLDPDGSEIMKYQPNDNNMYFLTGAYGSNQTRYITIESGKPILIPVLNGFVGCDSCSFFQRVVRLFDLADDINKAEFLQAKLDGKDIPYQRITSNIFDIEIKEHNPFLYLKNWIGHDVPVIADGYWVLLQDGLSPGQHTLMTHGIDKNGYSSEVRYNIQTN